MGLDRAKTLRCKGAEWRSILWKEEEYVKFKKKKKSETSAKAYKLKMEIASRDVDIAISHVGVHNNDEPDDVIEYTNGDVTMSGQNILESISLPEPDDDECLSSRSSDLTYPDQKNNITVSGLDENSILKGFKTRPRIQVQEGFFEKMQHLDVSEVNLSLKRQ